MFSARPTSQARRLGETKVAYLAMVARAGGDWHCFDTVEQAKACAARYPELRVWVTAETLRRAKVDAGPHKGQWSYYWAVDRERATPYRGP